MDRDVSQSRFQSQADLDLKPTGDETPVAYFSSIRLHSRKAARLMRERFRHPLIRLGVGLAIVFFILRSVGVV